MKARHRSSWYGRAVVILVAGVLVATSMALAAEPVWPALPHDSLLLAAPKGKAVTVSGMTMNGGVAAVQGTDITVTWDDENLTVVFDCTDAGVAAEWAKDRDSDKTWKDDSVAVLLDMGHKHVPGGNFVSFKLSAAGALQDAQGNNRNISWSAWGSYSEVTRTDKGWKGMIRIPWKGLGMTPREGEIWGVNFTRLDHDGKYDGMGNAKISTWAPFGQAKDVLGTYEGLQYFGHLVFAAKDAAVDQAAVAVLRETVKKEHSAVAEASIFPHEGDVLVATGKEPAVAKGFTVVPSGAAPKQDTTVSVTWSPKGLDVVFDCADTAVFGEQQGRDNIKLWKDDCVYVWLDIGHMHSATRELAMIQLSVSGAFHDIRNGDPKYDIADLVTEVSKNGKGWRAHLVFPWKGMGVDAPKPGDVWGINFMRMDQPGKIDFENMQSSSWRPVLDGDVLALDRWGHIVFASTEADIGKGQENIRTSHDSRRAAIKEHSK